MLNFKLSTLFDNVYFMVEKLVRYNLTCFFDYKNKDTHSYTHIIFIYSSKRKRNERKHYHKSSGVHDVVCIYIYLYVMIGEACRHAYILTAYIYSVYKYSTK